MRPAFLFLTLSLPGFALHPGEQAYKTHCAACHMIDTTIVGPSLVGIAKTYPADKKTKFIAWTQAPGKKNPKMIQMPSMAHVPESDLGKIHDYILARTKGVQEKKRNELFPEFQEPQRELPYVVRASLPGSSPASIAVVLPNGLTLCWDTELCRLRYLYEGTKTNLFSIWRPANLPNEPFYHESSTTLITSDESPQFLSYQLINKFPEFHYRIGSTEIRELIGSSEGKVTRTFTVSGEIDDLNFSPKGEAVLSSNQGQLKEGQLRFTGDQTKSFTLTIATKKP
ncbi:MAG: c-type cytochrome [Akkermansiaceae bacterium]